MDKSISLSDTNELGNSRDLFLRRLFNLNLNVLEFCYGNLDNCDTLRLCSAYSSFDNSGEVSF
jgi:hypothetical protein